jgi:glycosyltransferase involved in cell wall biosynthesis
LISPESPPLVSLIMATVGRIDEIARFLAAFEAEAFDEVEIILVDQSLGDKKESIIEIIEKNNKKNRIRYFRDEGKGLSRARNIGLAISRGRIVGFPDDDCWYSGDIILRVVDFFKNENNNENYGIISGQYSEPNVINEIFPKNSCDLTVKNCSNRVSSVGLFIDQENIGQNTIYFDENIGAGTAMPAGEETDLVMRLLNGGVKGRYEPNLIIFHNIERRPEERRANLQALQKAYWYVISKNYDFGLLTTRLLKEIMILLLTPSELNRTSRLKAIYEGVRSGRRAHREPCVLNIQ